MKVNSGGSTENIEKCPETCTCHRCLAEMRENSEKLSDEGEYGGHLEDNTVDSWSMAILQLKDHIDFSFGNEENK